MQYEKNTKYTQINTTKSRLCTVKCTHCDKSQSPIYHIVGDSRESWQLLPHPTMLVAVSNGMWTSLLQQNNSSS